MTTALRNIKVDTVSLVDKAAIRDPLNPERPRRFLLVKREGAEPTLAELRATHTFRKDDPHMAPLLEGTATGATPRQRREADAARAELHDPMFSKQIAQLSNVADSETDDNVRSDRELLDPLSSRRAPGVGGASGESENDLAKAERRLEDVLPALAKAERDGDRVKAESLGRESRALQTAVYAERRHDPSRLDYGDRETPTRRGRT